MRAYAAGLYCAQAAVELLIGHQRWLCRDDFVDRLVRMVPDSGGAGVLAVIGWRAAVRALSTGRLPCSDSEGHVLRLAASVVDGVPVDLGECLSILDEVNVGLVVEAVLRASGRYCAGGEAR